MASVQTPASSPSSLLAGKGLGIFLIVGICVGGLVLIVFVVLLICYISKRKKRNSRRSGEPLPHLWSPVGPVESPWKHLLKTVPCVCRDGDGDG